MRLLSRIVFVLVLIASAGTISFLAPRGVETDLLALVGAGGLELDSIITDLSAQSSANVRVLAPDARTAAELRAAYPFDAAIDPTNFLETVRTHGKGLLARKSRELLEKGDVERIRRSVRRRDFSGIGLFPKEDDPYYFLTDFVTALRTLKPEGLPEDAQILTGNARAIDAANPAGGLLDLVRRARENPAIALSGPAFHTALAQRQTIREINGLGALSLAGVLLVGFCLFRSFRFVLPMVAVIACGFLVACAAVSLSALPGRPHALTFLFGTTLIGLGVDYCYHALSSERRAPDFKRKLRDALLTTSYAFAPMLFSSIGVLRQMAMFSIAGLLTIYSGVLKLPLRLSGGEPSVLPRALRWRLPLPLGLLLPLLLLGCLFCRPKLTSDPSVFHRPDPVMAAGEARFAELTGGDSELCLVPLKAWQERNAVLKEKMGGPPAGTFLTAEDLPAGLVMSRRGVDYLMLPSVVAEEIAGANCIRADVRLELKRLFNRLLELSVADVGVLLVLLMLLALIRGLRTLRVFVPPLAAILATCFCLGILGEPFTFFHLLSFFVVLGLGVDYAIFHGRESAGGSSSSVVFYSFLTSLVGFGLLAFTSFPPTRAIGTTIAIGLLFAYLFSLPRRERDPIAGTDSASGWASQREQAAGKVRLWLTFAIYRCLGKSVAKACAFFVVACAYPFLTTRCGFRKALNFAWGLMDKLDACTLRRDLPRMTVRGDTGWMNGGCFILSTHVGTVEVLPALENVRRVVVHAFQQMSHNAQFTALFTKYLDRRQFALHPVEEIGVETAVEMKDAIERGEIVLMAADRLSAGATASVGHEFLGRPCRFPKGVFRFAKLMESPVYALTCVRTGWNAYEVEARRLEGDLLSGYVSFLETAVRAHPEQWFQFYDVFATANEEKRHS